MGGINSAIPLMGQAPQLNDPLAEYQKSLQIKSLIGQQQLQQQQSQAAATEQQQRELQLKQAQQQDQDMQLIRETAPKYVSKGPDGTGRIDYDGLTNDLASRGVNPMMLQKMQMDHYQMVDAASKAGESQLANQTAHNKAAYEVLEGIKGVTDPDQRASAYSMGLNKLKVLGMDTSSLPATPPDDKALESYETQLGMHGQILADAATAAKAKLDQASALEKQWQKFPELGALVNTDTGEVRNVSGGMMSPAMLESKYLAIQQKKNTPGQPLTADEQAFSKGYEHMKELVPQYQFSVQSSLLNPDTKAALGQNFAQTGVLPQGLRSPAMSAQIMNAGIGNNPGVNLAAAKAGYKSDAASLANVQKTFDNVNAFENTAGKNLDVFLNEAKKVTDLGLPIANLPARYIAGKLGGTDQAAFDAARTTALTEIAKVLSSANAGSGVLSDGARHEVEGLIKPDATLAQITSAANILKNDMANRHQAYADELKQIQGRIGGKPTTEETPAPAQHVAGGQAQGLKEGQTGKGSDGKTYVVKDGKWQPQ